MLPEGDNCGVSVAEFDPLLERLTHRQRLRTLDQLDLRDIRVLVLPGAGEVDADPCMAEVLPGTVEAPEIRCIARQQAHRAPFQWK